VLRSRKHESIYPIPHTSSWHTVYSVKHEDNFTFIYRDVTCKLVKRAEQAGFRALVLTVDAPVFGIRNADVRNKFRLPAHLR
jgi:(S)-2-hydroxy-acid oxidase